MELSQLPQGKMGTTNKIELDRSISIKISLVVPPQWRIQGEAPPPPSKFFHFNSVFGKNFAKY